MDRTVVFFKAIEDGFTVNSVLAEFDIFGMTFTIRWYGAIIAFGFLLAVLFAGRMAYKWKMNLDKMIDVLIFATMGGIIGARLYYCLFQWEYYSQNPGEIIQIWNGGLAIYGGIIGGLIAAFITCRVRKLNFFNLLDLGAMGLLIGQGIGRWGNFTNQEAFGTNTDLPWGMWSPKVASYIIDHQAEFESKGFSVSAGTFLDKGYVHPTFLYESIWCLLGFGILYLICKKFRKFSGQLFLCYGIWYGVGRTIFEGFRTDSLYIGNSTIRVSQLLSALLVISCLVALIVLLDKYRKNPKPIEGIDYFPEDESKDKKNDSDSKSFKRDAVTEIDEIDSADDISNVTDQAEKTDAAVPSNDKEGEKDGDDN